MDHFTGSDDAKNRMSVLVMYTGGKIQSHSPQFTLHDYSAILSTHDIKAAVNRTRV